MENDAEETFSPMLLEDSPPPDETKKRAWPCRLQIPIGILIVGLLVGGGVLCFLSLADSKDVERVEAGNIFHFVGDFQERNRRHLLSSGGCTIEQATDYYGWDLEGGSKIKVTANQQECADYSASTPGSRFWTWSKTTKKCYPKSSKAGRRGAGIELVSGNNRCANSGSLMTTKVKTALDGLVDAAEAAARGAAAAAAAGEDVEFSMEEIKEKGDYENLCYTCSVILVGFQGKLQRFNTYSTGYADSASKSQRTTLAQRYNISIKLDSCRSTLEKFPWRKWTSTCLVLKPLPMPATLEPGTKLGSNLLAAKSPCLSSSWE